MTNDIMLYKLSGLARIVSFLTLMFGNHLDCISTQNNVVFPIPSRTRKTKHFHFQMFGTFQRIFFFFFTSSFLFVTFSIHQQIS